MLKNLRNRIDYRLRSLLRAGFPVHSPDAVPRGDRQLQQELGNFLTCFPAEALDPWRGKRAVVLDIGARNFFLGPVLEAMFSATGIECEIHGIEIDAYRRMSNLRTRRDYGEFYAKQMRNGFYHPIDFLDWSNPFDIGVIFHPFVHVDPHVAWGLPKHLFRPEHFFDHFASRIRPSGIAYASSPDEDEFERLSELMSMRKFNRLEKFHWRASDATIQKKGRIGSLWRAGSL